MEMDERETGTAVTDEAAAARAAVERQIETLCATARQRLEARSGPDASRSEHYRLPAERPFTAAERDRVTILFGGLTRRHERLIQAAFESCGYRAQPLPQPDLAGCLVGKQYCNNGVCNPAYFTIGNLIRFLHELERSGVPRQEILDRYVFFTAGNCGPCRFGMYEAEYRLALRNSGFEGFRVLRFQQNQGVRADTGEPGLRLSLHLGLGAVNAFNFGDVLNGFGYEVRPFEVVPGQTDARLEDALERVAATMGRRPEVCAEDRLPAWLWAALSRRTGLAKTIETLVRIHDHLAGPDTLQALEGCRDTLASIEVDRLRVKPVVKITGEFWAQTTEGDGNFNMFAFLEREGAHVVIEPIGGWVFYLVNQARANILNRRGLDVPREGSPWSRARARAISERRLFRTRALLSLGRRIYERQYNRARRFLGGLPHALADQTELARLAHPFYHRLARGGEGHLEVGKNLYYTARHEAHLVLSLKPFGCMPSTQSDGVQSLVSAQCKDMLFLTIETAAEGELSAHSRVQMALVEARARAQAEFQEALASTGRSLDDITAYVARHPHLRSAFYRVPRRPGVAGTAATFALHVGDLMRRERGSRTRPFRATAPDNVTR